MTIFPGSASSLPADPLELSFMIEKISEQPDSHTELWRQRWQRLRTRPPGALLFALGVITVLVVLLAYNLLTPDTPQLTLREVNDSIASAMASATPPPAFSEGVYQLILPSMVLIQTDYTGQEGEAEHAIGSGVVINTNGDILTALHVVADATKIDLSFADGTQSTGTVAVAQPENDIAVLSADQPPAQIIPAVLGNPGAMRVGDEAYVVGHPLGLTGSMSAGIISGFDRSFKPQGSDQVLQNLIQIDAAVNPGNSGGPLLNRYGQVIGIVTALANPTDQNFFIGIGFAVPITIAGGAADLPPY
jgi:S1-C subfamily serine protease